MKANRINALYAVLCIILIFGIVLGVTNIENLEKSSLIDPDYVENAVSNMRRNYIILGDGWSGETAEMYESIYAKDVTSGNACIVGSSLTPSDFSTGLNEEPAPKQESLADVARRLSAMTPEERDIGLYGACGQCVPCKLNSAHIPGGQPSMWQSLFR